MNISRLLPFLPLLLLLPAPSGAAPLIPSTNQTGLTLSPSDLCPLVQIVEHELCNNNAHNNFSDLCVLLQKYNTSFCSQKAQVIEPLSNAVLSVRTLEHEFLNKVKDIHELCPILNLIDQELCTSRSHVIDFQFYPKELCPLLNITYEELCA